ncbi:hypothetical protein B4135_2930 [Caldibacillus debilis]|uniref:Uncharacterized protein n=1 Tax=Caldibacillus debilis TaxID=301148 RepID=A0A150LLR9_9BACI|nr:hypothetical protein B4135_2930 [Caldibacillus debilis]
MGKTYPLQQVNDQRSLAFEGGTERKRGRKESKSNEKEGYAFVE